MVCVRQFLAEESTYIQHTVEYDVCLGSCQLHSLWMGFKSKRQYSLHNNLSKMVGHATGPTMKCGPPKILGTDLFTCVLNVPYTHRSPVCRVGQNRTHTMRGCMYGKTPATNMVLANPTCVRRAMSGNNCKIVTDQTLPLFSLFFTKQNRACFFLPQRNFWTHFLTASTSEQTRLHNCLL